LDRDYVQANNAYMEMAIGNAPWPVGVTRSGIHQRPGSSKAYVSNVAHVMNDETQRKLVFFSNKLISSLMASFILILIIQICSWNQTYSDQMPRLFPNRSKQVRRICEK
jgi:hypothetical protein